MQLSTQTLEPVIPQEIITGLDGLRIPCPFLSSETIPTYNEYEVGLSNSMPYADILYSRSLSREREKWLPLLQDQIIVDLAAGKNPYGYLLACEVQAAGYVAVEAHHASTLMRNLSPESLARYFERFASDKINWKPPASFVPYTVVALDMLTFLQNLNAQVSIFAIGLNHILPSRGNYIKDVSDQISRVLSTSGCLLTFPDSSGISAPGCYGSRLGCSYIYTRQPKESDPDRM